MNISFSNVYLRTYKTFKKQSFPSNYRTSVCSCSVGMSLLNDCDKEMASADHCDECTHTVQLLPSLGDVSRICRLIAITPLLLVDRVC